MWLFTTTSFVSVVADPSHRSGLVVRARVRDDLDALRVLLPALSPTVTTRQRDYFYRARCRSDEWATALARMAVSIKYSNFKGEVLRTQGHARAELYAEIWHVMRDAENKLSITEPVDGVERCWRRL